jgi:hypothetical protein
MARDLIARLFAGRHAEGAHGDPLFRMQPERWLESRLRAEMSALLPGIQSHPVYSQVPTTSSGDRGMLDLLAPDRDSRLTVIEGKADEDLHLPMQALDYWIRVQALIEDRKPDPAGRMVSAFERAGYFPGVEVSALPPRLPQAAPALRIHPTDQPVLRHQAPQIEWELRQLSEGWRRKLKTVSRVRSTDGKR